MGPRTVHIELVELNKYGGPTSFESSLEKILFHDFKDARGQWRELNGKFLRVQFSSFAIGFVEDVLVIAAKCCRLACFSKGNKLGVSCVGEVDGPVAFERERLLRGCPL